MNDQLSGFLYVLINPAMPGLIKIGKTQRSTIDRAKELSAATGVPTPFLVVYEKYFHNCSSAEFTVHSLLESMGLRSSVNREFFTATTTLAIDTILEVAEGESPVNSLKEPSKSLAPVAKGVLLCEEGKVYYFGTSGHLVSLHMARTKFQQTIKFGSVESYLYLANIAFLESSLSWSAALNTHVKAWQKKQSVYFLLELSQFYLLEWMRAHHFVLGFWGPYLKVCRIQRSLQKVLSPLSTISLIIVCHSVVKRRQPNVTPVLSNWRAWVMRPQTKSFN